MSTAESTCEETVRIDTETGSIYGTLATPEHAWGSVLVAHGCGNTRHLPASNYLVDSLHAVGLKTLEIDLLTPIEDRVDAFTARHRFDIGLLTDRISIATEWLQNRDVLTDSLFGYFATGLESAAALRAAAERPEIAAVVCYGGRPDMAGNALARVEAATLLMVGDLEQQLVEFNQAAYEQLRRAYRPEATVVAGATHVFDQQAAKDEVSRTVSRWFVRYLGAAAWQRRQTKQTINTLPYSTPYGF